jgi:hypothetical protein
MICPKCSGITEKDNKSCSCGWTARGNRKEQVSKQCAFNDHGLRCEKTGSIANTTNGEGPWYCRDHFATVMGWGALKAVTLPDESQEAVDRRVNAMVPKRDGESMHDWSMRCRDFSVSRIRDISIRMQSEPGELG